MPLLLAQSANAYLKYQPLKFPSTFLSGFHKESPFSHYVFQSEMLATVVMFGSQTGGKRLIAG